MTTISNLGNGTKLDPTLTISPQEAADRLGVAVGTLRQWRYLGGRGPRHIRCGRVVRYRLSDISEYLDQQTRTSTSDQGPAR